MKKFITAIIILLIAGIISIGFRIGLTKHYEDWLPADGVVTDVEFFRSASRRGSGSTYHIYYTYTVDGVTYSGIGAYSGDESDTSAEPGLSVTVWYDPADPTDSSYHPPGPGLYPYVPFIFSFPLLVRILLTKKSSKRGG